MIIKFLKWYNDKFKKMPVVVLVATLSILIAGIGSVSSGIKEIVSFSAYIKSTLFIDKYEEEYKKISQLNTGLSVEYIDSIFGVPKVRREYNAKLMHFESFYDCKGYLLHTISDEKSKILLYSITITDPKFYAPVPLNVGSANPEDEINNLQLGKMKLSDLRDNPIGIGAGSSSKYGFYSEVHYFGNPGKYKYYLFGYSQLGCNLNNDTYNKLFYIGNKSFSENKSLTENEEIIELRKEYKPNSFGVIDEGYFDNEVYIIGFDYMDGRNLIDDN